MSPRKETNPFRRSSGTSKDGTSVKARPVSSGYPTPPPSASPRRSAFPDSHRAEAFGAYGDNRAGGNNGRARASSLGERFPGDQSHKPLDIIRRDSKRAHRSPHLKKRHIPGADTIDRLDTVNGAYHHEGPYDAALLARNSSFENSPIAAVRDTTDEALRATPRENVVNSVQKHRPLDGVASIPPGGTDRFGRRYDYKEGDNMMIVNGGNYKRWPGIVSYHSLWLVSHLLTASKDYHPDDIKGKGEPNFTIDRALKEHKHRGNAENGIEMKSRPRANTHDYQDEPNVATGSGREVLGGLNEGTTPRRSASQGKQVGEGLKKRFGSLRRKVR